MRRKISDARIGDIDAVILCGGAGTRLQSVVRDRPKPMALVGGRPFLDVLMDHALGFGIRRFILCAGYKAKMIVERYGDGFKEAEVIVSVEPELRGTAGALLYVKKRIRSNPFIVMNGDSYCPVDLKKIVAFHQKKGGIATIGVATAAERGEYGTVSLDRNSRVVSFEEKRKTGRGLVNAGIYIFEKEVTSFIPEHRSSSIEKELIPSVLPQKVFGFRTREQLLDIGTPERYAKAQSLLKRRAERPVRHGGGRGRASARGSSFFHREPLT